MTHKPIEPRVAPTFLSVRSIPRLRISLMCGAVLFTSGCVQEMANQPRIDTYEQHPTPDGQVFREQVAGTVARGQSYESTSETTGRQGSELVPRIPIPVTMALVERGRERYGIFCSHCHGLAGDGDGMVVQRGFHTPPSYHIDRLRAAPDGHFFNMITNGSARMPAFSGRIEPRDRWAVTAYIRALQTSRHATGDELSATDLQALNSPPETE